MINNTENGPCLYTIGHSDHEMTGFVCLLARHGISVVADVRSQPYSRFHGQFNRDTLAELLKRNSFKYVFLGQELGARRTEPESYQNGQARYDLIRRLPAFQEGLRRIRSGMASHRVALLCAEKDPITCHRMVLVCRCLRSEPIVIRHILHDGSVEPNEKAELRLLEAVGLPTTDLFHDRDQLIERAYDIQSERIAYSEVETPIGGGVRA
jgi:uncharacterized protein (DUF488 family)